MFIQQKQPWKVEQSIIKYRLIKFSSLQCINVIVCYICCVVDIIYGISMYVFLKKNFEVKVCNKLGTTDILRRIIRRVQRKNNPEKPKNLLSRLPEKWKTTMGNECNIFLIYMVVRTEFLFLELLELWLYYLSDPVVYKCNFSILEYFFLRYMRIIDMLFKLNWKVLLVRVFTLFFLTS